MPDDEHPFDEDEIAVIPSNAEKATVCDKAPLTDAVVQLTGEDGSAFSILGRVRHAIRESNHSELEDAFWHEATSGDYDHLLQTCMRYVEVN